MKKKAIIFFIILVIAGILAFAFSTRLKIVTYNVKSSEINSEIKLALVTDLHSCYYGEKQSKLLNEIEKYHPDAVLLCGDIFDDVQDDDNANIFIDSIAKKYKTYYVSGNHEWWSGRMEEMFDSLAEKGVFILRGSTDKLTVGNETISISGIDDPEVNVYDSKYTKWEEQLEKAGESLEKNNFNLLLAHRPELAQRYFEYDFDLVLVGHAHGGQFRIPYIMNGVYAPGQVFFHEFAGGIYDFNGRKMIVSRGLAKESTRIPRVFNRPELVFVNLIPQE